MSTSSNSAFEKIDSLFDQSKVLCGGRRGRYGPIQYHSVLGIPPKLIQRLQPDSCFYVKISGSKDVPPHKDHGYVTALNLYIKAASSKTTFYKQLPGTAAYAYSPTDVPSLYHVHDVVEQSHFVADDGDTYLLNTSEIHSVTAPNGCREFVQLAWRKKAFSEVFMSISDQANLDNRST